MMRPQASPQLRPLRLAKSGTGVIACIDGSNYLASVCDHAAWFADRLSTSIQLLTIEGPGVSKKAQGFGNDSEQSFYHGPSALARHSALAAAATRLMDEGVQAIEFCAAPGSFPPLAARVGAAAEVIVVGRRGTSADKMRGQVGSASPELIRLSRAPVCIAPKLFFPIHRALIVVDAKDRRFADRVATLPCLDRLEMRIAATEIRQGKTDLRVVKQDGERRYPLLAARPRRPPRPTPNDLIVLSRRTALGGDQQGKVARALLASRLPLLFC